MGVSKQVWWILPFLGGCGEPRLAVGLDEIAKGARALIVAAEVRAQKPAPAEVLEGGENDNPATGLRVVALDPEVPGGIRAFPVFEDLGETEEVIFFAVSFEQTLEQLDIEPGVLHFGFGGLLPSDLGGIAYQRLVKGDSIGSWEPIDDLGPLASFTSPGLPPPGCRSFVETPIGSDSMDPLEPRALIALADDSVLLAAYGAGRSSLFRVTEETFEFLDPDLIGGRALLAESRVDALFLGRDQQIWVTTCDGSGSHLFRGTLEEGFSALPDPPSQVGCLYSIAGHPKRSTDQIFAADYTEVWRFSDGEGWNLIGTPERTETLDSPRFTPHSDGLLLQSQTNRLRYYEVDEDGLSNPADLPMGSMIQGLAKATEHGVIGFVSDHVTTWIYRWSPGSWDPFAQASTQSALTLTPFRRSFVFTGRFGYTLEYAGDAGFCESTGVISGLGRVGGDQCANERETFSAPLGEAGFVVAGTVYVCGTSEVHGFVNRTSRSIAAR